MHTYGGFFVVLIKGGFVIRRLSRTIAESGAVPLTIWHILVDRAISRPRKDSFLKNRILPPSKEINLKKVFY